MYDSASEDEVEVGCGCAEVEVVVEEEEDCKSTFFPPPCFVQICTRNRVCAHVHRTLASSVFAPPSLSPSILSLLPPFSGAEDWRKIDRSKYV